MTAEKWARLKDVFQQASDLHPDARATFIESLKQRDASLAYELTRLLEGQFAETGALDHPLSPELVRGALQESESSLAALQPGQVTGDRYEIVELLGAGGFGRAYTALDCRIDNRKVVLKVVIPPRSAGEWSERRFEDEVRSLARLDHPGIVGVFDIGRLEEGYLYLVMQYVAGKPLDALLRDGPLPLERGLALLRQIADSL